MERFLFLPLDDPKPRTKSMLTGWALQFVFVALALSLNALFPQALPHAKQYLATNLVLTPAPVEHAPQPRLAPKLAPIVKPIIVAKAIPLPQVEEVQRPMPPQIEVQAFNKPPKLDVPVPVVPKVALNQFSTGSSAPQTTHRAALEVQTGGFGDPNGVPAKAGKGPATIAALGSFNLPEGSGQGNGLGGRHPGVTASTGFGNGTAVSPTGHPYRVTPSNFDDHVVLDNKVPIAVQVATIPAKIIEKPSPSYTEEARRLKIEGAVRLQLKFTADGRVEIQDVLSKLGHGLDEQAVRVAQQIKFKPAQLEGRDVESVVVISIIFQLAS